MGQEKDDILFLMKIWVKLHHYPYLCEEGLPNISPETYMLYLKRTQFTLHGVLAPGGAGVYCNNQKCNSFEVCKLDPATKKMKCMRA
ncbi:salivary cysteine-rich peptide precursor [Danaus plexippus plexippus]|uniref:Salivary cysteine-rich peptide n=1 Tax=Danaus plexippus plexippus TaxID=278856 RepID=A0A212EGR8_DANPL|nr:salivary cysteine-rich peptide precursor [Danaus plexippus plexippus]